MITYLETHLIKLKSLILVNLPALYVGMQAIKM